MDTTGDEFDDIIANAFGDDLIDTEEDPGTSNDGQDSQSLVEDEDGAPLPDELQPQSDDPIAILQSQLAAVMQQAEQVADLAKQHGEAMSLMEQAKEQYLIEVTQKLNKFDAQISQSMRNKRKVENDLSQLEAQKDRILADISHEQDAMNAMALLEAARERWEQIKKEHDWLWVKIAFEYQNTGVEFMASAADRDLFGVGLLDEMGLGKTLQVQGAVDLIQHHPLFEQRLTERLSTWAPGVGWSSAVLYLAPDSIKHDIQRELAKWSDRPAVVLEGPPERRKHLVNMAHQFGMTLVVGYAQLRDRNDKAVTPELFKHEWPIIIADEIQEARNEASSTFVNVCKIVQLGGFFFPMSGTPIENRAVEFWVILHLLTQKGKRAGEFYSSSRFEQMYLYSWDQTFQHGGFEKLMDTVKDMILRRTKQDVALDLPDKIRTVHFLTMTEGQRDLYEQMRQKLYVWLDEQESKIVSSQNFLSLLTRLRQISLLPSSVKIKQEDGTELTLDCDESSKVDEAMKQIRQYMEVGKKVVIAANFNHVLHHIEKLVAEEGITYIGDDHQEHLVRTGSITGKTKPADKTSFIERFNDPDDDLRVLVGNIKAMGLGLNLQGACSDMILLDLYWNPKRNEQTEDRLHRTGQKFPVNIHIYHNEESVDNFIAQIIEKKLNIFGAMFDTGALRQALDDGMI